MGKTKQNKEALTFYKDPVDGLWKQRTSSNVTGEITPTGLKNGGNVTEVELVEGEWRQIPVNNLSPRNAISVQNVHPTAQIKINHEDVGAGSYVGMLVFADGGERSYDITDNLNLWGRVMPGGGNVTVNVEEIG